MYSSGHRRRGREVMTRPTDIPRIRTGVRNLDEFIIQERSVEGARHRAIPIVH